VNQKLYVGNLPFTTDEQTLEDLFAQAGPVGSVRVMRDQATGRARGFAFVEMGTEDGARAAIEKFHGTELGGRALTVNEARPQAAGAGRGRDFGGGAGGGGGRRREPRW
jgi:RNA recognition motif-containing protein